MQIILGSGSRWRRELLEQAGVEFSVLVGDLDEKQIRDPDPEKLTLAIAVAKGDALAEKISEPCILITCDQVVCWNDEIREKPDSVEQAREYLQSYSEHNAKTYTAVVLTNTATGESKTIVDVATVYFKHIPEDVIETVIAEGEIFKCAGGFQVEGHLISQYIDRVAGDLDSVKGLPVAWVTKALHEFDLLKG